MRRFSSISLLLVLAAADSSAADGVAFFESHVRPLLVKHCYECHSQEAGKQKGGLLLDRKEGWVKGGDAGPALVPGKPEKSVLLHSVRYEDEDLQMPPKSKLPPEDIRILEQWIAMGAPDPRVESMAAASAKKTIDFTAARQGWAFRPLQKFALPAVKLQDWPRKELDAFILAELEAKNLTPAADADRLTLMRRLSYDLTGLPPSDESDPSDLSVYVEKLFSSPQFGEKWGRYWLDLARYADSNGGDRNYTFYQAWRYRNYVIDAFNQDKSFYEFIREQIAGDLMPAKTPEQRRSQMIASSFLALGPKMLTERDKEKLHLDTVDEQIDTIGRAFLGLTVGCARCHDHKFDPFSQQDYYALAGFFRSTEVVMGTRNGCVNVASWVEQALPQPEPAFTELKQKVARLELAMRLKVERDFMETVAGKKALTKLPLAGVIYDEASAELVGDWKQSNLSKNRFGDFYIRNDKQGQGIKKAVFRGALPETGIYEVRLAYPAKANCDKRVPITVEAFDGVHEIVFDQTKKPSIGGLFEPVGRFHFEKGGRVNVIIGTQGTKDFVIVDAVQFISEKDIERESTALAMANGSSTGDPLLLMDNAALTKELDKQVNALKDAELAMAPRDARDAGDIHLRVRGEVNQLGPKVPRSFPTVLHSGKAPKIPAGSSGRLQLAAWMTSTENALLDRVIVNRLWAQLFGRGIVGTVDNFGVQGEKPTHPALLDHLAAKFRASGGSVKALIREMVLSRTYQLAAEAQSPRTIADPENRLFGRRTYRRLTAEEIRDSLLFLTGELKLEQAAATALTYGEDLDKPMKFDQELRRSIYLPVARNNLAPELEIFDVANPEMVSGDRPLTTVPTQALYLLNSPFLPKQGARLAQQAYAQADPVTWLHKAILGRAPSATAVKRANDFINTANDDREKALADLAHVLLASTEFLFLE
ncbi:DUF1553 domain-containing protein [Prosthecobacter sp.]